MSVINSDLRLTELPKHIRQPAVAGMFYPNDPVELQQMVAAFLDKAQVDVGSRIRSGSTNHHEVLSTHCSPAVRTLGWGRQYSVSSDA